MGRSMMEFERILKALHHTAQILQQDAEQSEAAAVRLGEAQLSFQQAMDYVLKQGNLY
ncbi:hypothetical protein [Bacillus chungangensis]|uniref:DUF1657 domain-containing protein n=1 Tax=Bacillus chungangensis TaxID=587633 RepID=A0ABT9WS77_9BACI|nr:hypothetical protein [Bacillus chungangensis]MDQ0176151.1 hypothetical protein [Bacillus chungangensis]